MSRMKMKFFIDTTFSIQKQVEKKRPEMYLFLLYIFMENYYGSSNYR